MFESTDAAAESEFSGLLSRDAGAGSGLFQSVADTMAVALFARADQTAQASLPQAERLVDEPALERLSAYMKEDFAKIDANNDGRIEKAELPASLATMTNKDEMQILSWMSKNMEALEHLGDKESGLSKYDLVGLKKAVDSGTGDLGFALRNTSWLPRANASAAVGLGGTALMNTFLKTSISFQGALAWTAALLGGLTAIDAAGYYMFERPKIDEAIRALKDLPDLTVEQSRPA